MKHEKGLLFNLFFGGDLVKLAWLMYLFAIVFIFLLGDNLIPHKYILFIPWVFVMWFMWKNIRKDMKECKRLEKDLEVSRKKLDDKYREITKELEKKLN